MEKPQPAIMCSRQGKATVHMHCILFSGHRRKARTRSEENSVDKPLTEILADLEKQRLNEEKESKNVKPTPTFRSISREQHEFATRNRTNSPRVGKYEPKYHLGKPRSDLAPRFSVSKTTPKSKRILVPSCFHNSLDCSYPGGFYKAKPEGDQAASPESPMKHSRVFRHTMSDFNDYQKMVDVHEKQITPIAEKPKLNKKTAIDFNKQMDRPQFVKSTDPPNPERFAFVEPTSPMISINKRPRVVDMSAYRERHELFGTCENSSMYDDCKEKLIPKLSRLVIPFDKMIGRKELVHEHMLKTPFSPEYSRLENAFRSTIKA